MKNRFLAIAILAIGFATTAQAQNSATNTQAVAKVQIVTPISIDFVADMNFGSLVKSASTGTVVLAPDGTVTPTGVTLFSGGSAVASAPAEFTVAGEDGYGYTITLPADDAVVLGDGNGNTMNLTGFAHNASGTFTTAAETFQVGATLHVGANQASGNYVSPAFTVSVAYN